MSTLKRTFNSNQVIVNNKSNFKSHLVKCQAILDDTRYDQLLLKALGKATTRATYLANQLNLNNFNTFIIEQRNYEVEIIEDKAKRPLCGANKDSFDPEAIDISEQEKKVNRVPGIEIIVRKSPHEIDKLRQTRTLDKDHSSGTL